MNYDNYVLWLMLDVNNFGPVTYYLFKSGSFKGTKNHINLADPLECYKMILLNLGGHR